MKTFIRRLSFNTEEHKEMMRLYLNGLGFYCLSEGTDLMVYAIPTPRYVLGLFRIN